MLKREMENRQGCVGPVANNNKIVKDLCPYRILLRSVNGQFILLWGIEACRF